jgi:rRNA small subunit pseudouridine methyltransferase Nep1
LGERIAFLLAEASLELVPEELWDHPEVKRTASRYGIKPSQMILEKTLHYHAMKSLPLKWKRGRPDILHITLLNVLDSPLAEDGSIEIFFHTFGGEVFWVSPDTRITPSYERFRGLMAQLLSNGRVPVEGRPLIKRLNMRLEELLREYTIYLASERGKRYSPCTLAEELLESARSGEKPMVVIGLFPRGDLDPRFYKYASKVFSFFSGRSVKAWTIASRVLCCLEGKMSVHGK